MGDLWIKKSTIQKNLQCVHVKINAVYEHMNTLTVDDWKAEGKCDGHKLMIESMHHVSSQMKEKMKKQLAEGIERGAEW